MTIYSQDANGYEGTHKKMRAEIKKRVEQVRRGEVPEGYLSDHGYIHPNDWPITTFYQKFKRITRKNNIGCQQVLTISAQQGLIDQKEYYNSSYASEDRSGYSLLNNGDYAYNKSYSQGYPFGAIKRLTRYEMGIVSPLYLCFSPKESTCADYYTHYFEGGIFNREIYKIAQEGARNHGLLNIAISDFFNGYLLHPPEQEQQKIAEVLTHCDKVIDLKKQLLEAKRRQKK